MNDESQLHEQLIRYVGGDCTADEARELSSRLERDPAACELLAAILLQASAIRDFAQTHPAPQFIPIAKPAHWLQRRPLAAAAAGVVLGMLCTSVVFGYAISSLGNTITLLHESFESGPMPLVTGRPNKADIWSGDYSEIVGEQLGVKPVSGIKMLRFLRGDYEGRSVPDSFSSDVFRLIDVRSYRQEFADGGAVVQLSAVFNAAPFGDSETYKCGLTIFALDSAMVDGELLNAERVLATQSLARSTSSHLHMDRDSATWQRLGNELRVPPHTDYLLIQIGVSNASPPKGVRRDSFSGHFADEMKLVFAQRPEISLP